MKRRFKRGLALLLTLCLLGGNLAFAEELPETVEEPVIKEETVAEKEEAVPGENAEKEEAVPGENAENADVEAEDELETSEENVPDPVRGAGDTIYLNGQSGDNNNDGLTPEKAVKTFGQAKKLATDNKQIEKIIVIGTVEIENEITLKGTNAKILRGKNFNKYVFKVPAGKTATLKDITIDGNSPEMWEDSKIEESLIRAESKSTLNIQEGAVIKNNKIKAKENTSTQGGGIYAYEATLHMSGGVVEGNQATYGGGIYLYGSTMHFTGGTVQNNRSELVLDHGYKPPQIYSAGGGICAYNSSTIYMSGDAKVLKNIAHENGGGISVGSNQVSEGTNILYMSGGIIDGNEAGSAGGGIFIQAQYLGKGKGKAYISAGQITNNKMNGNGVLDAAFGGGGIYVNGARQSVTFQGQTYEYNGENGELHLVNAVIRNNAAYGTALRPARDPNTGQPLKDADGKPVYKPFPANGGGYAACPISKTVIRVSDGVAMYQNQAKADGKDLYVLCSLNSNVFTDHYGNPTYELSERMLGGALWNWKTEDNQLLPLGKYTGQLEDKEELALHTDFKGSDWVEHLGTVWITGNISTSRGGGIGSNGSVFFGTEGDTTKITVEKKWENEEDAKRPEKIQVQLLAKLEGEDKGYVVETRTVTATDEWKITFDHLPMVYHDNFKVENGSFVPSDAGKKIIYSVKEVPVPGYTSEVTGDAEQGFLINNKRKPETPPPTPSERFIEIPVEKIWKDDGHEDKRPTEITVTLYADGARTNETLVLSAANEWKGVFRHLPEKKDGNVITYTVKETEVKGYESVRTGNQSDGFVLTNTYKPEKPPTPPTPPIPPIPFVRIPRAGA